MMPTGSLAKESAVLDRAIADDAVHFTFEGDAKSSLLRRVLVGAAGLLLLLLVWQAASMLVFAIKGVTFPTPLDTVSRLADLLSGDKLYRYTIFDHLYNSLVRWISGYSLAVVLGILIGAAMGTNATVHDIMMVPASILQLIPGLAWIPVALLIFGLGESATVFMIFMTVLPTIIICTAGAIRSVPEIYLRSARMMNVGRAATFFRVLVPAASLQVIDGLRVGMASGWKVLIAAEMVVGAAVGLGYVLIQARWSLDFEAAFVSIMVICIMGLFIEKCLFSAIERRVRERLGLEKGD